MDKAIDTLELLREYLNNEVHPNCEYYIYSNLIDITDKAIAELEAYKAKIDELKENKSCETCCKCNYLNCPCWAYHEGQNIDIKYCSEYKAKKLEELEG